jgi:hypothetical protein
MGLNLRLIAVISGFLVDRKSKAYKVQTPWHDLPKVTALAKSSAVVSFGGVLDLILT